MKYQRAMNGPKVFTICQMARGREGSWNFATICFHAATFFPPSFKSDIVQMRKYCPFPKREDTRNPGAPQSVNAVIFIGLLWLSLRPVQEDVARVYARYYTHGESAAAGAVFSRYFGGPLAQGPIHLGRGEIICPWHRFRFDLTTGQSATNAAMVAPLLPTEVRGDKVWVDISALPDVADVEE